MNQGYQALRDGAAYFSLLGRGRVRVAGEDRARLLHAMSTNHVQQLRPGEGCYAFFLNAQGRVLADAHILCLPDTLLLDTAAETHERLFQHIEKYIIADDVTLEDLTVQTATLAVEGPRAEEILQALGAPVPGVPYAHADWPRGLVARLSYTGSPGFWLLTPPGEVAGLMHDLANAGAVVADADAIEVARLEYGMPRYGVDFSEATIPQETPLMHAVHFNKGCYLGQEIVERVRSRGHVNKQLVKLHVESNTLPAKGAKILADGKEAGEITSAAYSPLLGGVAAFGILRVEAQRAAALQVGDAPARLR